MIVVGADVLRGGPWADLIDEGFGPDTLRGGSGNDLYGAGSGADKGFSSETRIAMP